MRTKKREKTRKKAREIKAEARVRLTQARKEMLPANNLFAIIVFLLMVSSLLSSYLAYMHSRNILEELTGEVSAQARLCVNKQPSITQSCNTTAEIGVGYYCDVDGSDPDNDTLTFYDNTILFDIDQTTGEIIFTPDAADAGTHIITVIASDGKGCGNSNTSSSFSLYIPSPPGPAPGPGGGGGGGGGGGTARECIPQWECTPWGMCSPDGTRTRTCYTLNNCLTDKPDETQSCIYVLPPKPSRRPYPEFYLCNFDIDNECFASFGMRENWIYTYNAEDSTINIDAVLDDGADVSIDDTITFFAGLKRINGVDVTGDGIDDFEYIPHQIVDGRVDMTVRLIERKELVLERPVYIWSLPAWLSAIMMFSYNNACIIILLLMIILAVLIWLVLLRRIDGRNKNG